jgi:hypothetical protein
MAKKKSKDFRFETYFVRGKMKRRRIRLIDGLDADEWIRRNADDVFLVQEGYYEVLHERENERAAADAASTMVRAEEPGDDSVPF